MSKENLLRISSILALIFSLTGAILLVVTPWAYWWYRYQGGGYIYYGSGVVNIASGAEGVFILFAALLLFVCATISILTLLGKITSRTPIVISLILAIIVLIMIVIGAILTAAILGAEGLYWTFGPAFYGGISGTLLTILCTLIMIYAWEQ